MPRDFIVTGADLSYMSDLEGAERWVDDWQAHIVEKATQARELTSRVMGLRGTAESRDGAVRVTVETTGVPMEITLGDAVAGWKPERIAAEIMKTMRQAQQRLTEAVEDAAQATIGAESETGRAVLNSYYARFPKEPAEPATDRSER
jgi:DNA-binding protein YbaB